MFLDHYKKFFLTLEMECADDLSDIDLAHLVEDFEHLGYHAHISVFGDDQLKVMIPLDSDLEVSFVSRGKEAEMTLKMREGDATVVYGAEETQILRHGRELTNLRIFENNSQISPRTFHGYGVLVADVYTASGGPEMKTDKVRRRLLSRVSKDTTIDYVEVERLFLDLTPFHLPECVSYYLRDNPFLHIHL